MFKQGPSTNRERETLLLLREALPEFEINPHMRLANVVKGKLPYTGAMGQYEIDFVVQDTATGEVICAIELDDLTHDTEDGRRRDGNKNRWMAQARIKLIRIRMPEEALAIRERITQPIDFNIPEDITYSVEKRTILNRGAKYFQGAILSIIAVVLVVWVFTAVLKSVTSNLSNKVVERQNQLQQQSAAHQAEASLQKQQEMEKVEAQRRGQAQQPRYERVLIKGKSARECSNGNVINNASLECMKDHYETVLVSGSP